jgi:hypothetical protein
MDKGEAELLLPKDADVEKQVKNDDTDYRKHW